MSVLCKFSIFFLQYKAAALQKNVPRMNTDVLASYTQNIAQGQKNDSRINAVYSGCLVVRVGGSRLGVGLIKCCDFQRSLLARSISDPSVLATRGAYVFIFSLCCVLSVCNVFTTPRAGHQSRPLPLFNKGLYTKINISYSLTFIYLFMFRCIYLYICMYM